MARTPSTTRKEDLAEPGTGVATVVPTGMPDYLVEEAKADAGKGVSTDQSDNIVPMIYILQPLSPQVDENSPARIPDAKPGSIWLRNYSVPIVPGDEGILFQPCFFSKDWPEWIPRERGGGFVARHPNKTATADDVKKYPGISEGEDIPDVDDAAYRLDATTRQKVWSRKSNNNDLVLTRSHAGYVVLGPDVVLPYVIPLKGASHSVSRNWMFSMMSKHLPNGGGLMPSFACLYRLTTRQRTNAKGKWYAFDVKDAGYVDAAAYRRGRELNAAFESGEKVAEAEASVAASDDGAAGDPPGNDPSDQIPF